MSELKPIPKIIRNRPSIRGACVVATNQGWVAIKASRDPDEVIQESRCLYERLEELELLTPNDLYYKEHGTLQINLEEKEDADLDTDEGDKDEEGEKETELEENKEPETVIPEVAIQTTESNKEGSELTPLNELEEINSEILKEYPAEVVKEFAIELDLGAFSTKKEAVAAIVKYIEG